MAKSGKVPSEEWGIINRGFGMERTLNCWNNGVKDTLVITPGNFKENFTVREILQFRDGANLTVNGKFVIREVRTTQVDEVDVFDDSEDPEAEFIPGLAVAGDFTCDRLTCDGGQLTCEPTGTITCPEFNLANSICTVAGTITGGGPLLVFTVTGGSIDGNGLIQGDLQLVGDAVLSPGSSSGTLTVNTLTMGGGTTYTWEVSHGSANSETCTRAQWMFRAPTLSPHAKHSRTSASFQMYASSRSVTSSRSINVLAHTVCYEVAQVRKRYFFVW